MNTTARLKQKGKNFEIIVDIDKALKYKKGESSQIDFLEIDQIFSDHKKGFKASDADLKTAFGGTDTYEIAGQIVKKGEVLLTQEHRDEEREKKLKQIIELIVKNAVDPKTGSPHTPERIKSAITQAHINIKNTPIEEQMSDIIDAISKIIPIKVETKRVKIIIPAMHTGKAYGVASKYKEKEDWLSNGDLEIVVSVPAGLIMDFYDKLNNVTHGSAVTEEIKGN